MCAPEKVIIVAGVSSTLAPPASARSHSPRRSAWHAWWMATSDELQAVSTATAGPCSPNRKLIRPAAAALDVPMAM